MEYPAIKKYVVKYVQVFLIYGKITAFDMNCEFV